MALRLNLTAGFLLVATACSQQTRDSGALLDAAVATEVSAANDVSDADRGATVPICDGTPRLRFAYQVLADRFIPGQQVMFENGLPYLFVDGMCHYWVTNGDLPWEGTRTGTLDAATAQSLASSLHYARFTELAGAWRRGLGTFDTADSIFHDGVHSVVCQVGCDDTTVPTDVQEMRDRANGWVEHLWDRGAPAVGAAWIMAVRVDLSTSPPSPGIQTFRWPLAQDLDAIALDQGDPMVALVGRGTRIDDPDASTLRGIRTSYAHGDHGAFFYQYLPAVSDSGRYRVYTRDAVPFENAHGLVPIPGVRE